MGDRQYEVTITGVSPLLMHADNITWAEHLKKWREVPENKKLSVAGDDRSPAFGWLGCLYHDGQNITIPGDNLMRCMMEGGASVLVPGGKNGKTFKAQTQSGMLIQEDWPILVGGKSIPFSPLQKLEKDLDFDAHQKTAVASGFMLYVKRAKIGQSKHVRVRPRFDRWEARGAINVWDDQITTAVLGDVLRVAGANKGLGDWRPSSRTPGPYGRFTATLKQV